MRTDELEISHPREELFAGPFKNSRWRALDVVEPKVQWRSSERYPYPPLKMPLHEDGDESVESAGYWLLNGDLSLRLWLRRYISCWVRGEYCCWQDTLSLQCLFFAASIKGMCLRRVLRDILASTPGSVSLSCLSVFWRLKFKFAAAFLSFLGLLHLVEND